MKWLTLDWIRAHSRLLKDVEEDDLLELYGEAAEESVLNVCQRTYEDFIDNYGAIPKPIFEASLMLVELSYTQRSPVSQQQMYGIGYAFDFMVKPYMRLASVIGDNIPDYVATLGDDLKILVTADLPDGLTMYDVPFTVTVVNVSVKDKEKLYDKSECIMTTDGDYVVLVDSTLLGIGRYMVRVVFEIPDEDYESGYRKQVVKINPHVVVKG